ncbi:MAG: chemotaxis-specific protein-glutamate methyltransferase CheB [Candidatus Coatesbacteria bacterium]|nr:MAG: chemotaxis-specific protein-glutamate methyltransferase CheB [Candidatus Coatesbacteria bacterium]
MSDQAKPIKVLVAEDSAVVARVLVDVLTTDPDIVVVGVASDGAEAVEMTRSLKPDLITMDVRMPRMDGLVATRKIMEEIPTPIIVVSASVNVQDMNITFEALRAGALEIIEKPRGVGHKDYEAVRGRLIRAVKAMSEVKVVRRMSEARLRRPSRLPKAVVRGKERGRVIVIGSSTGGPAALEKILARLPEKLLAPVLVVQHIAPGFVAGLAEWLNQSSALNVKIAEAGEEPLPGTVYFAPDGYHMQIDRDGRVVLDEGPPERGHRPSIDRLFTAAAQVWGPRCISALLTGMGSDGVSGLGEIKRAGGAALAQDEGTAVIYGMPREAAEAGFVDKVLPLEELAAEFVALTSENS